MPQDLNNDPFADNRQRFNLKKNFILSLLAAIVIIMIIVFFWLYINQQKEAKTTQQQPSNIGENSQLDEVDQVMQKVRMHIMLPEDIEPRVATILDALSLAEEQPFYQGATDGDKLIVYNDRAIIYSPQKDILVNVGTVKLLNQLTAETSDTETDSKETEPDKSVPEIVKLDIRNGSGVTGAAKSLSDKLSADDLYQVINIGNANNANYSQTLLINISGYDLSSLEDEVGVGASTVLPQGEAETSADAVIIIGKN